MPMIPRGCFAMLASIKIGAIHSVVFGGFASDSLALRINDASPKLIITADCGLRGKMMNTSLYYLRQLKNQILITLKLY